MVLSIMQMVCVCVFVQMFVNVFFLWVLWFVLWLTGCPALHLEYTVLPSEALTSCEGHQGLPCLLGHLCVLRVPFIPDSALRLLRWVKASAGAWHARSLPCVGLPTAPSF